MNDESIVETKVRLQNKPMGCQLGYTYPYNLKLTNNTELEQSEDRGFDHTAKLLYHN
jgi:hypothetical protein